MSDHSSQTTRQGTARLSPYAWLSIVLLLAVITTRLGLWVADSSTFAASRHLMVRLQLLFVWLPSLGICLMTARVFLGSGQSGILMFSCGSLLWCCTTLIGSLLADTDINPIVTVETLGGFGAAYCHLIGWLWHERLPRPGRYLVAGYTGVLLAGALIFWVTMAGWTPVFFVRDQGDTPVRQAILLVSLAMFAWAGWQMIRRNWQQPLDFYHWYGLGLVLFATGTTAIMVWTVQDGIGAWVTRLPQYLGSLSLLIAAFMALKETGRDLGSPATGEAAENEPGFRAVCLGPLSWRTAAGYGLAALAVAAAMGLRLVLEARFGPGLPTYLTFYPAVLAVAVLAGLGPGLVTTGLTGLAVAYWILAPLEQFSVAAPGDRVGLIIFTGMSLGMNVLAEICRRYRHKSLAYDRAIALHESNARLATFAQASLEGIVASDAGRIVDCNHQFAQMSGYLIEELRGMKIDDLLAPEDHDRVMAKIRECREPVIEHTMVRKDGTPIVVEAHDRRVFPNHTIRYTTIRDITGRKQMEQVLLQAKKEWEATFDSIPDPIAILDEHHRFLRVNRAMAERLGRPPKGCIGLACYHCVHDMSGPPVFCPHSRTLKDGATHSAELQEDRLGGYFLVTTTPLHDVDGQMIGTVHVARDITLRKQKEEEVLLFNRMLNIRSRSSEAMMEARNEIGFLREICRIIKEDGGYVMVWIGLAENDEAKTVRPVAGAGYEAGYLEQLNISWADSERGRGPTGTAIRTGQVGICRNMHNDPKFAPWREEALKKGYSSSIALPLRDGERCFGALSIYHPRPDGFPESETGLLMEITDKLAFNILTLRHRQEYARVQEAFHRNQSLLEATQRLAQIGGWDYDTASDRVTWTDEMYRIFVVSPETFDPSDFTGIKCFFAPGDWERLESAFRQAMETGVAFDLTLGCTAADGKRLWVRTMGQAERQGEQTVRVFGNVMDITELYQAQAEIEIANRKLEIRVAARTALLEQANEELFREAQNRQRTEEALREGEARWRSYVENAPYGIFISNVQGKFLQVNPEACRISGYTETELLGMTFFDLSAPDSPAQGDTFADFIHNERIFGEYQCHTRKGELRWWSVAVVHLPENCFLGFINDITERRQMGLDLQASEERYRTLVDATPDFIYSLDRTGTYTACNRAFCTAFGLAENQVIGRTQDALGFSGDIVRRFDALHQQVLAGQSIQAEVEVDMPGMEPHTFDVVLYPIFNPEGEITGIRGINRDVTAQRKIEAQLLQSQKMEAVGHLAGGVAHDFNNMLTVINGNAEMALMELDGDHPIAPLLSGIIEASKRSTDLTRQLLTFARKQTVVPRVMELNKTVQGMLRMLQRLIGEGIKIVWNPGENLWPVRIDPSQVDQILANLAVNARDAMCGAGQFLIETANVTLDHAYCARHTEAIPGPFVLLTVSDSGCGIDQEVIKRIFEPFFTTKAAGKGSGLGLATVYGIVQQNQGFIQVYSEPGAGTTFKIYLPRYAGAIDQEIGEQAVELAKGCGETVLVVEDEALVRNLVKGMVASLGYRVLIAGSPAEACGLVETHRGAIHLLLMDVVMPELNGRELSEQLLAIRPEMRCLFMSGYSSEIISHHGVLEDGVHFIPKPLKLKELACALRAAIGQKDLD